MLWHIFLTDFRRYLLLKIIPIFLLSAILNLSLVAQDSKAAETNAVDLSKLDQGNSLERKSYKHISENYQDKVTSGIRLLTIVTANFSEEVPDSQTVLENIRKSYQTVNRFYYQRAYIASGKEMVKLEKELTNQLGKFAKIYETKANNLLVECADLLSNEEQNQLITESQEAKKNSLPSYDLGEARQKLRIAYGQIGTASEMMRKDRYYDAIVHYRIAKDYGIRILTDFKESEADKKTIQDKYSKDLSDNRNQIFKANEK